MTPQLHRRLTKIVAFLTAMRGSALIMVSGEQVGSTEKWTAPAAEARKKNPVAVTESSLTAGQKIYLKRCVACHGKTRNGDGPDAADLGKPRPTPIKSHLIFARLDSREAAILITLQPGNYTAILSDKNGTPPTGVGLVEVYDINSGAFAEI